MSPIPNNAKTVPNGETQPSARKKPASMAWNLLFMLPYFGLLWPSLYAHSEPQLLGFPFFYWYQFLWVILSAVITGLVYLATHRR